MSRRYKNPAAPEPVPVPERAIQRVQRERREMQLADA